MSVSHRTDRDSKVNYFLFNQSRQDCRLSMQIRLCHRPDKPQVRPPRRRRRPQTLVASKIVSLMLIVSKFGP